MERLGWVLLVHVGRLSLAQSVSADDPSSDMTDAWKAAVPTAAVIDTNANP